MPFDTDYPEDIEFSKLLSRHSDVDLTVCALELARDAYPQLDFRPSLDWIAARGQELSGPVAHAKSDREVLETLCRCLAETHGIYGEEGAFERADSSYLHRVIETGRGIPISLSVLYLAVAKAANIDLVGVGSPMHFLTCCETSDGPLYVDAYTHGRILTQEECVAWLRSLTKLSGAKIHASLQPLEVRPIIIRMLNNLKALHIRQEDWGAALRVQHRLTSLQPSVYAERRDFGVIALKADRPGEALEMFEWCLKACPADENELLMQHLAQAKRQLARWN